MPRWFRTGHEDAASRPSAIDEVRRLRTAYAGLSDDELKRTTRAAMTVTGVIAAIAVIASRVLSVEMFDVQLVAALALSNGAIVEMQTGEGKTLAAVPAIAWFARSHGGAHVLTANDYLARRDAEWMRRIYEWAGLSVGAVQQGMSPDARRVMYQRDITYATANEVGFDYLRDLLRWPAEAPVQRAFATAVIDEADSILIDDARIPLVIAGGVADHLDAAVHADRAVRRLIPGAHFTRELAARSVALTAAGAACIERALGCPSLYDPEHLPLLGAVQDALHAHALLRRDVDYLVKDDEVQSIDEMKGRVVHDRRWPAGLQAALELKEGVARKRQGRVLGSVTIENLVALYPMVCGMTGTAATQADEFREIYGLDAVVLPTNRPVIREDHPDRMFRTTEEKDAAVIEEIRRVHESGRPVLVGTLSVEESEHLSRSLQGLPHHVLNARNEDAEAALIEQAGERGSVTISTNMAGRGVDIRLGSGVAELGGLHVIGTNRHESRRIDHQLRGRAGRQGDPGSSVFFVANTDRLMTSHDPDDTSRPLTPDQAQRMAEGQNLDVRLFLRKYESVIEGQRLALQERRQALLTGATPCESEAERLITLTTIDELWSDYLSATSELRAGTPWISLGGRDPLSNYLTQVYAMFEELQRTIAEEVAIRLERGDADRLIAAGRGATWTYLTTDDPFGPVSDRIMRTIVKKVRSLARRG